MIVSTRAQGVDCPECESSEPHVHVQEATREQLIAALTETRLANESAQWKRRAEQHGCNVEEGNHECA